MSTVERDTPAERAETREANKPEVIPKATIKVIEGWYASEGSSIGEDGREISLGITHSYPWTPPGKTSAVSTPKKTVKVTRGRNGRDGEYDEEVATPIDPATQQPQTLQCSKFILDSLVYAKKPILWFVTVTNSGNHLLDDGDRYLGKQRTYHFGGQDLTEVFRDFLYRVAKDVSSLASPSSNVSLFLRTKDEKYLPDARKDTKDALEDDVSPWKKKANQSLYWAFRSTMSGGSIRACVSNAVDAHFKNDLIMDLFTSKITLKKLLNTVVKFTKTGKYPTRDDLLAKSTVSSMEETMLSEPTYAHVSPSEFKNKWKEYNTWLDDAVRVALGMTVVKEDAEETSTSSSLSLF